MSNQVDNRVVEMQFNNSQFESGIQTSLRTLDKLKDALHLKGASKGLDDVQNAAGHFSLDGMASAIESVNNKFSALGAIGFSVLNNLVSRATDAGIKMVKALSVDQIAAGWTKFGQKTGSVATLVSQGYSLDEVNKQMERLNWFTDETSYNYVDMANNIGKFTATGQDLESSVTAMMGIANWAALSGQNATVASRAMYQLSQAMSKGALRYDDWRSIQNASMDTKEFRENALEAAVALEKVKKNMDDTYTVAGKTYTLNEMFTSEALTRTNWFGSDVMMKTFQKYSSAVDQLYEYTEEHGGTASEAIEKLQNEMDSFGIKAFKAAQEARSWGDVVDSVKDAVSTGWMSTFELIFGNYDEATKLWTMLANNLYDVFMFGTEKRNELFADWKELGGNAALVKTLENSFEILLNVMEAVRDAFENVFPPITGEMLKNISVKIMTFTNNLKNNEEVIENVKTVFTGFFHILNLGRKVITFFGKTALTALKGFLELISPITEKIKSFILSFNEWISEFDKSEDKFSKFKDSFSFIKDSLSPIGDIFNKAKESIKNFFSIFTKKKDTSIIKPFEAVDKMAKIVEGSSEKIDKASVIFEKVSNVFDKLKNMLSAAAEGISGAFSKIKESFSKDDASIIASFANTGFIGVIAMALKKFIDSLSDTVKDGGGILKSFKGIGEGINDVFGSLKDSLKSLQGSLKAKTLKQIAVSIAILAGSVFVLSLINPERLAAALGAIAGLFVELGTFVTVFEKINSSSKFKKINNVSTSMIKLSAAVLILAIAMAKLSSLSLSEIGRGLLAIAGLLTMTTAAAILLSRFSKHVSKGAKGMISFSIAIGILAAVMKSISSMSLEEIGIGLLGVLALVTMLTASAILLSKLGKSFIKGSTGLIIFASAIAILGQVVKTLSSLSVEELTKGLVGVAVLTASISGFILLTGNAKKALASALSFVMIASALLIVSKAMTTFGNMEWTQIEKGMTVVLGVLGIASVLSMALSSTNSEGAILALAGSMVVLGIALEIIQNAFSKIGNFSWENIGKGFVVLAGSLLLLGAASLVLAKVTPALLAVSGALALLGLGLQLIASAFVTFNIANLFVQLGESVKGVARRLKSGTFVMFFKNILEVLKELVKFIPLFIASFVQGLIDGFVMIANSQAKLVPAIVKLGIGLLAALEILIPKIVKFGLRLVLGLLQGIDENIEKITEVAGSVIFHFLVGLSNALPMIIMGAIILMYNFINGLAEGIRLYQDLIFAAEKNLLSAIIEYALSSIQEIVELIPVVGEKWAAGIETAKEKVREKLVPEEMEQISASAAEGLIAGFRNNSDEVEDAGAEAGESGASGLMSILDMFTSGGETGTSMFAEGLLNNLNISDSAGLNVGESAEENIEKADYEEGGLVANQGFAKGLLNNSYLSEQAASVVGNRALSAFKVSLASKSPSKKFEKEGYNSDQGYANGLLKFSNIVENASGKVGDKAITSISSSIAKIDDYVSENMDSTPTIRPVLDMSGLESGVNSINDLMGRSYTLSHTSYDLASQNARMFSESRLEVSTEKTDKGVVSAIGGLSEDINKLGDSIKGMGFYLDGRKFGKISTPTINRNLYIDSIRRGRNN